MDWRELKLTDITEQMVEDKYDPSQNNGQYFPLKIT